MLLDYFQHMLAMIANLCAGNASNKQIFTPLFPRPQVTALATDRRLTEDMRASYCKLLCYMYVAGAPSLEFPLLQYSIIVVCLTKHVYCFFLFLSWIGNRGVSSLGTFGDLGRELFPTVIAIRERGGRFDELFGEFGFVCELLCVLCHDFCETAWPYCTTCMWDHINTYQ